MESVPLALSSTLQLKSATSVQISSQIAYSAATVLSAKDALLEHILTYMESIYLQDTIRMGHARFVWEDTT